jgi:hypothetical protein
VSRLVVDPFAAEAFLDQRVDRKRRQVPFVEHDRVTQRDRALVVGRFVHEIEQGARARARPREALESCLPIDPHVPMISADATRAESSAYLDLPRMSAVR